jgi:hypothetical protein
MTDVDVCFYFAVYHTSSDQFHLTVVKRGGVPGPNVFSIITELDTRRDVTCVPTNMVW